jgi:Pretoxin HINT domain
VAFLVGMRSVDWAKTSVSSFKWVAATQDALDVYGAGKATYSLYQSYQDNGRFERDDVWNLLAYVPFIGAIQGVKKFFAANKAKNAAPGTNNVLRSKKTGTNTGRKCFVAGTEILTTEGIKNIEDIKVGDWVIADDPTTPGEIEAHQVTDTFARETTALVDLYVDGELISTTGEHPFWTTDKGWMEAKDLEVGSLLQTEDGRVLDVDRIEKREGQFEVYNFNVEGFHTYFVSALGILVHNADYPTSFGGIEPEDLYIKDFPTSQEPITFRAEIEINSKTLHLKDIGVFPSQSRRISVSPTEIRGIIKELRKQAKAEGFEKLRITGKRSSGASFDPNDINSGNRIDRTWDL